MALALKKFKIDMIEYKRVLEVKPKQIILSDKSILKIDKAILSTNSMTPKWLTKSDILLTKDNYILVNKSFQTNYKYVFASGDVINFDNQNLKKLNYIYELIPSIRQNINMNINSKYILNNLAIELAS